MCAKARTIALIGMTAGLLWHGGLVAVGAQGASLADVARQEQERRKSVKAASKVLTNKDLRSVPAPAAAAPQSETAPAADTGDASQAAAASTEAEKAPEEPAKDQAYWSARFSDLQTQLSRNETFAVALQARINALANEYTNQGDGVRQQAIAAERQKAIDELNRVTKQIAADKKAIADLQEEARRTGVPPGWLR
jgi:hypothetical protein